MHQTVKSHLCCFVVNVVQISSSFLHFNHLLYWKLSQFMKKNFNIMGNTPAHCTYE